jgi:hypothetical protein
VAIAALAAASGCAARPAPAPATVEIGVDLPLAGRDVSGGIVSLIDGPAALSPHADSRASGAAEYRRRMT